MLNVIYDCILVRHHHCRRRCTYITATVRLSLQKTTVFACVCPRKERKNPRSPYRRWDVRATQSLSRPGSGKKRNSGSLVLSDFSLSLSLFSCLLYALRIDPMLDRFCRRTRAPTDRRGSNTFHGTLNGLTVRSRTGREKKISYNENVHPERVSEVDNVEKPNPLSIK